MKTIDRLIKAQRGVMHLYWLAPIVNKSAQTGEEIVRERGPYIAQILGGWHRDVTDEEIIEYVRKMHGEDPVKIEKRAMQ